MSNYYKIPVLTYLIPMTHVPLHYLLNTKHCMNTDSLVYNYHFENGRTLALIAYRLCLPRVTVKVHLDWVAPEQCDCNDLC